MTNIQKMSQFFAQNIAYIKYMSYLCINKQGGLTMNAMIITTNDLTLTRMAVIAKRTTSELMAGAKAMMIENLKNQMKNGIAHFVFRKKDGSLREVWGTTNKSLVERHINGRGCSRENYATTAFFSIEDCGWRSFRWENLVAVY